MNANGSSQNTRQPSRKRTYFLPGFVLGFLLLATITCAGSLYAIGLDGGRIAELRGHTGQVWTPPPTPVTLLEPETPSGSQVSIGDDVAFRRNVTSSLVNIRTTPGYLGKSASDVIAQIAPGEQVELLKGPERVDGLSWWRVKLLSSDGSTQGWIAESTASGVQILGE